MYNETERNEIMSLLWQYANGNENAYESIYEKTYSKVRNIVEYISVYENDIEKVIEDIYAFVIENLGSVQDLSQFCDWLSSVSVSKAYYYMVAQNTESINMDCREYDGASNVKQLLKEDNGLVAKFSESNIVSDIWNACKSMPIVIRVTYLFYFVAGMSVDGIAAAMNCSVTVVQERINYIVKKTELDASKKEVAGKKSVLWKLLLLILLVVTIVDCVLYFGSRKEHKDKVGLEVATPIDATIEDATVQDATVTDSIVQDDETANFDEKFYMEKYKYWNSLCDTEYMSDALRAQYEEKLAEYNQAISNKDETTCIACEENMVVIYDKVKKYQLNHALQRYRYATSLVRLCAPMWLDWTLPDGTAINGEYSSPSEIPDGYIIYDFDNDGNLELFIQITLAITSRSGMSHFVYEYDTERGQWIEQFEMKGSEGPVRFFDNGTLWFGTSKSDMREHEWLGDLYKVNNETKVYDIIYKVHRRDSSTLFYVTDGNGSVVYDNLNVSELEQLLRGLIGNEIPKNFCILDDLKYNEDKNNYLNMLWDMNGVTGQEGCVDLGETYVICGGYEDQMMNVINSLGCAGVNEGMFTYYYINGQKILDWNKDFNDYSLLANYNNSITIFDVYPGMGIEEAKKKFELHGLIYYKQENNCLYYCTDTSSLGDVATIKYENGVVSEVSIGWWSH